MTTEGSTEYVSKDRSVSELLELESYQGMTDTEIESIIEHKLKLAHLDVQANSNRIAAQAIIESLDDTCNNMLELTRANLETVLKGTTFYVEPELETVTE